MSAITPDAHRKRSLLDLPFEMREKFWKHALPTPFQGHVTSCHEAGIYVEDHGATECTYQHLRDRCTSVITLLLVNKQVYREAKQHVCYCDCLLYLIQWLPKNMINENTTFRCCMRRPEFEDQLKAQVQQLLSKAYRDNVVKVEFQTYPIRSSIAGFGKHLIAVDEIIWDWPCIWYS